MHLKTLICPLALALGQVTSDAAQAKDVSITPAQVQTLEIKVADVKTAATETVALLPGTVVPALNARLVAAAPFGGTVLQVHVLPGQTVKKGDKLATLASRELLEAMSQLRQSEAELQTAEAVARRKRFLADKNIQNPLLADEAESQVAKVRAVIEQHKRTVALGSITIGEGGQYTIPAPADGKIVETKAMPGEKLDAMAPAITIDASEDIWLEAQVPAEIVARVRPGDKVQVIDGPEGKIVSIGGSLDRMTRSAMMLASVPAKSGLMPGQMVTLTILKSTETGGLTVPPTAVAWINDQNGVFVRNKAGFKLVPVTLRGKSPLEATISGGITPGQQVAASGLPLLERMLAGE
jgi:RND family efflux transporter MFP subunit